MSNTIKEKLRAEFCLSEFETYSRDKLHGLLKNPVFYESVYREVLKRLPLQEPGKQELISGLGCRVEVEAIGTVEVWFMANVSADRKSAIIALDHDKNRNAAAVEEALRHFGV